jgi:hypothetical protein
MADLLETLSFESEQLLNLFNRFKEAVMNSDAADHPQINRFYRQKIQAK